MLSLFSIGYQISFIQFSFLHYSFCHCHLTGHGSKFLPGQPVFWGFFLFVFLSFVWMSWTYSGFRICE